MTLLRLRRTLTLFAGGAALAAALTGSTAHAQFDGPPQDQPDMPVTAAVRAATVESLAVAVERSYVFPDVANRTAAALRAKLKQGGYNGLDLATTFGDSLSNDLRAIGKDRHFRVGYWNRELAPDAFTDKGPSPDERSRDSLQARRLNHGFERLMRLSGGRVRLRHQEPEARHVGRCDDGRCRQSRRHRATGSPLRGIHLEWTRGEPDYQDQLGRRRRRARRENGCRGGIEDGAPRGTRQDHRE